MASDVRWESPSWNSENAVKEHHLQCSDSNWASKYGGGDRCFLVARDGKTSAYHNCPRFARLFYEIMIVLNFWTWSLRQKRESPVGFQANTIDIRNSFSDNVASHVGSKLKDS